MADAGSTLAAARHLRVAQQALARQIVDLERELGVALFVRHPRGMRPTAARTEFLAYAREALAANARAVAHVRRLAGHATLRVGLHDLGRGHALSIRAVARFRVQYPHAHVLMDPTPSAEEAARVHAGALDVGVVHEVPDAGDGLDAERVLDEPITHVMLAAGHALARGVRPTGEPLDPRDLSPFACVSYGRAVAPRMAEEEHARMRAAGWTGRYDVEVADGRIIVPMVQAGLGWVSAPASFAAFAPPGVVFVPLAAGTGTPMDVRATTRRGEGAVGGDPLVAAFLACLREERDVLLADDPAVPAEGRF